MWGLTFLFPASMNGLFDSIEAEKSMKLSDGKSRDLYEEENRILDDRVTEPLGVLYEEEEEDIWSLT